MANRQIFSLTAAGTPATTWVLPLQVPDGSIEANKITVAALKVLFALAKADVGLSNVDNTADANKPVSSAQATAIALKQNTLISGTNIKTINGNTILGSGDLSIAGGGGGASTPLVFDATTSWGAVVNGYYSIAYTHSKGTLNVIPFISAGSVAPFIKRDVDVTEITDSNTVTIRVPEFPDGRFAGRIFVI